MKNEDEVELIDFLNVMWGKKWLIIIPTFLLCILVGVISFLLPKKWEIDAIIVPSKFMIQTEGGRFEEVVITSPVQIASQINERTYNNKIASELNLDIRKFPKIRADNIKDTNLIRILIREKDIEKAKLILNSLFNYLKKDIDKKAEVETKNIDTQIASKENLIRDNENEIRKKNNNIQLKDLDIK